MDGCVGEASASAIDDTVRCALPFAARIERARARLRSANLFVGQSVFAVISPLWGYRYAQRYLQGGRAASGRLGTFGNKKPAFLRVFLGYFGRCWMC